MMRRLLCDRTAASAAEFALVLPLLLILLFGIIDAGRFLWTYNRAEKAAQMGARLAIVTDYIEPGIASSYVGVGGLTQGDVIPASQFGKITCTSSGCTCSTAPCPGLGTANTTAFNAVVTRMQYFMPELTANNVTIEYSSSGLGYAGSPVLPDLSPLVTVKIGTPTAIQFTPLATFMFTTVDMPSFTTTLSAEDLSGAVSN
jgi:hypothetical protein